MEKTPLTRDNLIDVVNVWLDEHQGEYIINMGQQSFVSGRCQTDLRAFIDKCIAEDMDLHDAVMLAAKDSNYKPLW